MATRFPGYETVSGPASTRPPGGFAVEDTSGISRGVQNLASGLASVSGSAERVADKYKRRENASDFAAAEALWTEGVINIGNDYSQSTDFGRMKDNADKASQRLKELAAAKIRDPNAREEWLAQAELKRLHIVDGAGGRAFALSQENDKVNLTTALDGNARLMTDPGIDPGTRALIRQQSEGMLEVAVENGLLSPKDVYTARRQFLEGADEQLAINIAETGIRNGNAHDVKAGLAIPSGGGARSIAASAAAQSPGGLLPVTPELAALAAPLMGGQAPSEELLKDPAVNARYANAVMTAVTNRFDGDVTAAVIATAPGGSIALAERWDKTGHDESILPPAVRKHYREVMKGMVSAATATRLPIKASDGVDLANLDRATLDTWDQVQAVFGSQLLVISGARSKAYNAKVGGADRSQHIHDDPELGLTGRAIDVDVSGLKQPDRIRLIEIASALGFKGIGIYKNSLHFDTRSGAPAAWGPSYKSDSVPAWAADAVAAHSSGKSVATPALRARAPEYAALTYDQALALDAKADTAIRQQDAEYRTVLGMAEDNAPAAISNTGTYTGVMPTVDDYVRAWGADGIERFKTFEAAVDTAETAYGMRSMSAEEIAATVEAAIPQSTGAGAALESKTFKVISDAATQILKERDDDPAGYVLKMDPKMATAWEDAAEDSSKMPAYLVRMAKTQEDLGMRLELLPTQVADAAAGVFNNTEIPESDRMGAITNLVYATNNEQYQRAIYDQLVESGVPEHAQAAFDALDRGDRGAASRLLRAAMVDPDTLAGVITDGSGAKLSKDAINVRIQEMLLDENELGDVIYGISYGTADNATALERDTTLIERSVALRLKFHEEGTLDEAIKATARDMYGDVRVVTGRPWGGGAGIKITLPADADEQPYRQGFNALLATVDQAFTSYLQPGMAGAPTGNSMASVMQGSMDEYRQEVLAEGFFTNAGDDAYVFLNPMTGTYVADESGEPLTFTADEVIEAGLQADAIGQAARMRGETPNDAGIAIGPDPGRM